VPGSSWAAGRNVHVHNIVRSAWYLPTCRLGGCGNAGNSCCCPIGRWMHVDDGSRPAADTGRGLGSAPSCCGIKTTNTAIQRAVPGRPASKRVPVPSSAHQQRRRAAESQSRSSSGAGQAGAHSLRPDSTSSSTVLGTAYCVLRTGLRSHDTRVLQRPDWPEQDFCEARQQRTTTTRIAAARRSGRRPAILYWTWQARAGDDIPAAAGMNASAS